MNCCHKDKDSKNSLNNHNQQMSLKDMLRMVACCIGPLAGVVILGAFGINAAFLAALACPLMMGYMMWMMGRMESSKGQFSEGKEPLQVEAGLKSIPTHGSVKQLPQKLIKELPEPSGVSEMTMEKLPKKVQSSDERKVGEEKVQTIVMAEIKSVPVDSHGVKGGRE